MFVEEMRRIEDPGEGHVNMGVEIGVMLPQAKKHLEPPEAGRSKKGSSPRTLWRELGLADTLIVGSWPV